MKATGSGQGESGRAQAGPVQLERPRILLVHANPFQQVLPVPAYGIERLRTAVDDLATVRLVDPFLHERPYELLAAVLEEFRPQLVGFGIRVIEDCIVVDSLEGDQHSDVRSFLPEIKRLRQVVAERAPAALVVAGGASFSYFPAELLEHLEIEWGIVGAGEGPFRQLIERVKEGRPWHDLPGLLRRGQPTPSSSFQLGFLKRETVRDPIYNNVNGFPVRTRIGCAMSCSYCLTASIGRGHSVQEVELVLDEIEEIVELGRRQGTRVDLFFADDEFNLPSADHAIEVLEGLKRRKLAAHLSWRAYFNPTPFPDRLARLISETNGKVSLTVDTASDRVAEINGKPFRRRHLDAVVSTIAAYGLSADLGFIFGLPGEDEQTLATSIDFVRALPRGVEVCYSSGARVYPHTPLAALALADPDRLYGEIGLLEQAVYSAPLPPRQLARRLAEAFADRDNVYPIGVGFDRASRAQGLAYQALSASEQRAEALWQEALAEARRGGYRQSAGAVLSKLVDIALWHNRVGFAFSALTAQSRLAAEERDVSVLGLAFARALLRPSVWRERRKSAGTGS